MLSNKNAPSQSENIEFINLPVHLKCKPPELKCILNSAAGRQ